jgi:hypothetical protein
MWLTEGHPDDWPVVITTRGLEWWVFRGGFIEFLVGVVTHEFECPLFPDRWPDFFAIKESFGLTRMDISGRHFEVLT